MREKVRRIEKDFDDFRTESRAEHKTFITRQHFDDVLEPIRRTLDVVQKDVKEILRVVATTTANRPKG